MTYLHFRVIVRSILVPGEIPITTSIVIILDSVVLRTAYCILVCRHGSLE